MKAFHEIREYPSGFQVWHGYTRNVGIIAHWHHELEMIVVRSGSCVMHVNQFVIEAKPGDLIFCDSGDIHYFNAYTGDLVLEFLIFSPKLLKFQPQKPVFQPPHIPADLFEADEAGISRDSSVQPVRFQYLSPDPDILERPFLSDLTETRRGSLKKDWQQLVFNIDRELDGEGPFYRECVRSFLTAFWCRFLRWFEARSPAGQAQAGQTSAVRAFQHVLSYLEEHLDEPITLETIASLAGYSPSYTSRFFRQLTGNGFTEYLNMLRVSKAAELLHSTDQRILDIAYACGFGNVRTFNRVFVRYTGITPSVFRRKSQDDYDFLRQQRSFSEYTTVGANNPTLLQNKPEEYEL